MTQGHRTIQLRNRETEGAPVGACNGTNRVFTLTLKPVSSGYLTVFKNGIRLREGRDYIFTAPNQVTLTNPPDYGDTLDFEYDANFTV
jgi:hypothetical protein